MLAFVLLYVLNRCVHMLAIAVAASTRTPVTGNDLMTDAGFKQLLASLQYTSAPTKSMMSAKN